jgi:hypothetical protein
MYDIIDFSTFYFYFTLARRTVFPRKSNKCTITFFSRVLFSFSLFFFYILFCFFFVSLEHLFTLYSSIPTQSLSSLQHSSLCSILSIYLSLLVHYWLFFFFFFFDLFSYDVTITTTMSYISQYQSNQSIYVSFSRGWKCVEMCKVG